MARHRHGTHPQPAERIRAEFPRTSRAALRTVRVVLFRSERFFAPIGQRRHSTPLNLAGLPATRSGPVGEVIVHQLWGSTHPQVYCAARSDQTRAPNACGFSAPASRPVPPRRVTQFQPLLTDRKQSLTHRQSRRSLWNIMLLSYQARRYPRVPQGSLHSLQRVLSGTP